MEHTGVPPTDRELHDAGTVELTRALLERLSQLARKEVELARTEARVGVRRGVATGGFAAAAGVLFVAALCCGLVAAILAIGIALPAMWVAFVGFGLFLVLAVAASLVAVAEGRELRPERTIRQARQTVQMIREPVHA